TLPLITFHLLRRGNGEASIGSVYAANTVGAIAGVFFAIHVGLPWLGLKHLLTLGAGLDIALGAALLWSARSAFASRRRCPPAPAPAPPAVPPAFPPARLAPPEMASPGLPYAPPP